jgi:phage N-6-adenine-methyltransferase
MDDVLFSSSSDEWATPPSLFTQIKDAFGPFDLDPCGTLANHKAPRWYDNDVHGDGLINAWNAPETDDGRANVFVNPPFSNLPAWVKKARQEIRGASNQVVLLIPARTDTRVWQEEIFPYADYISFIKGRVKFLQEGKVNAAPFPSAIVVFRPRPLGLWNVPPFITTWKQTR